MRWKQQTVWEPGPIRDSSRSPFVLSLLLALFAGLIQPSFLIGAVAADETGVTLVGKSDKETAPVAWSLVNAQSNEKVVTVESKWGFAAAPPGRYVLHVLPSGVETVEVAWGEVTVEEGKSTTVRLSSGVDVQGRTASEAKLEHWEILDKKSNKVVARTLRRWGFTPLPPGEYAIRLLPLGSEAVQIDWGSVQVVDGNVAKVTIDSGVEVLGRSRDEPKLDFWRVVDKQTGKIVANTWRDWRFTPVPPGEYLVRVRPNGHEAVEIDWATVTIETGKTSTLQVKSGIELVGRSAKDKEPEYWEVIDKTTDKRVAHVWRHWGFTPVPPGEYVIKMLPQGSDSVAITWSESKVEDGKAATVKLTSGIELQGRPEDKRPPSHWRVTDSKSGKPAAFVWRRWGFTPLPPGEYEVHLLPEGSEMVELPWAVLKVAEGKAAEVTLNSGIELAPTNPGEKPPKIWQVFDPKTKVLRAKITDRWGFTSLPAGEYEVEANYYRWNVRVNEGSITKTSDPPLEDRLAKVTGAGKPTEQQRDPEAFKALQEEVELAIRRGAAWLKRQNELNPKSGYIDANNARPTIGILALIHAGEFERDPELANRCTDYLLARPLNTSSGTYANAITTMALRDYSPHRYRGRIFECAQWLLENQGPGGKSLVWGYGDKVSGLGEAKPMDEASATARRLGKTRGGRRPGDFTLVRQGTVAAPKDYSDNSCTQFAVLGMHAAATTQIKVPQDVWTQVDKHFHQYQNRDGGWGYYGSSSSYGSMTCAGAASLIVARHHLGNETPTSDSSVVKALEWLGHEFVLDKNPRTHAYHYYYLYGLERVGVLAGTEFFGDHEWYPLGARYLIREQNSSGSWRSPSSSSGDDYLDTCYAILFLRRATLPLRPEEPAQVSVASVEGVLPPKLLPAVELILDSSGSMAELVDGRPKYEVAREIANQLLKDLPNEMPVGLRLYGHWGEWIEARNNPQARKVPVSDPRLDTDSELVAPIAPLSPQQRKKIGAWLDFAKPRGKTPMIYSLLQAKNDFGGNLQGPKTVVLVSDGIDTCGGKLEQVAAAYRGSDVAVVVHVVGFDIKETDAEKQMREIAKLGGGNYYNASNARQLNEALRSALDLRFDIREENSQSVVAQGTVGGDPVSVKAGKYQLSVRHEGIQPIMLQLSTGDYVDVQLDKSGQLVTSSP